MKKLWNVWMRGKAWKAREWCGTCSCSEVAGAGADSVELGNDRGGWEGVDATKRLP